MNLRFLATLLVVFSLCLIGCKKNSTHDVEPPVNGMNNEIVLNNYNAMDNLYATWHTENLNDSVFVHSVTLIGGLGYEKYVNLEVSDVPTIYIFMEILSDVKEYLPGGIYPVSKRMIPGRGVFFRSNYYPNGTVSDYLFQMEFTEGNLEVAVSENNLILDGIFTNTASDTLKFNYNGVY